MTFNFQNSPYLIPPQLSPAAELNRNFGALDQHQLYQLYLQQQFQRQPAQYSSVSMEHAGIHPIVSYQIVYVPVHVYAPPSEPPVLQFVVESEPLEASVNESMFEEASTTGSYTTEESTISKSSVDVSQKRINPHSKTRRYGNCQFQGCGKCAQGATKFCVSHGGGRRCLHNGCVKGARGKLFCVAHGGGRRCIVVDCGKSAVAGNSSFCHDHFGVDRDSQTFPPVMDGSEFIDFAVSPDECMELMTPDQLQEALYSLYPGGENSTGGQNCSRVITGEEPTTELSMQKKARRAAF